MAAGMDGSGAIRKRWLTLHVALKYEKANER
jgi:hypothetical protein